MDTGVVVVAVFDEFTDADGLHAEALVHHFDGVAECDWRREVDQSALGEHVQAAAVGHS